MKTLHGVKDENGRISRGWKFGTFKNVWNVGGNLPAPRRISGWTIVSPDSVERNHEGNWQQFVPFAQMVISNYGCTSTLS